jgi:hypothetical protein
MCELFVDLC